MRDIPAALEAHLARQATTLCRAWRITRTDGTVIGLTEHDADLNLAGTQFAAAGGHRASDVESALGLAVDTSELAGAFSHETIGDRALAEGRFDGARVETFAVNWVQPSQHVLLHVHEIGEVSFAGEAFRTELRSLAHRLDQPQGRVYARRCDAVLGDRRCGVDLDTPERSATGTVIAAPRSDRASVAGLDGFAAGWFRQGLLIWQNGTNAGLKIELADHHIRDGGVEFVFWTEPPNRPQPGDAFHVMAGCSKTFETCREKFGNQLNFQGFPHLPGSDFAYGYADGDTVHDGRPLVE